jgi:hypothetical protein
MVGTRRDVPYGFAFSILVFILAAASLLSPIPSTSSSVIPTGHAAPPVANRDLSIPTQVGTTHSGNATPPSRAYAAMASDAADGYVLLFGGYAFWQGSAYPQGANDTWAFSGSSWLQLHPAVSPPPLVSASMAYDAATDTLILFGGWVCPYGSCFSQLSNETWEFHAGVWTHLSLAVSPSPRAGAAIVYDPSYNGLILVGGEAQRSSSNGTVYGPLADTWCFVGGHWVNLTASVAGSPDPSWEAGVSYDTAARSLVLFGGEAANGTTLNETWALANGTWSNLTRAIAPPAVQGASMTYVSSANSTILFGGWRPGAYTLNETWKFTNGGWTAIHPANVPPSRWQASFVYVPSGGYAILFGGELTNGNVINDSWTFYAGNWHVFGTNESSPPPGPSVMAFDTADNETMLLSPGYRGAISHSGMTWIYKAGAWTLLNATDPSSRSYSAITYDASAGGVLLYGGVSEAGSWLNDTWIFSGGNWTELKPAHNPGQVYDPSMTYDARDGFVILFAGPWSNWSGTWEWNGTDWLAIATNNTPSLSPFWDHPMAYDPLDGYLVMAQAGNQSCPGVTGFCFRTWSFSRGNWTERTNLSDPLPPGVSQFDLVWDGNGSQVVMFGGSFPNGSLSNQTWGYVGGVWTKLNPAIFPAARFAAAAAYDGGDRYVLLYGGLGPSQGALADTWAFTTTNGWSEISPSLNATLANLDVGVRTTFQLGQIPSSTHLALEYQGLPPGCLSEDTPTLNCTPQGAGAFVVRVGILVVGSATLQSSPILIEVRPSPSIAVFAASPNRFYVGNSSNISVAVNGGTAPFTIAYSGLPQGCANANHTVVECKPPTAGNFSVRVDVSDAFGERTNATLVLKVLPSPNTGKIGGHPGGAGGQSDLALYLAPVGGMTAALGAALVLIRVRRRGRLASEGEELIERIRRLDP